MEIKEILTDWKHWLGWVISTFSIGLVLKYLVGICLCSNPLNLLYVFMTIVIVDVIKHVVKLQ